MTDSQKKKMGRPPKEKPKKNLWAIRFDDDKNALLERLIRLWSNEGETKSETLERVIVYALKVFWNGKKKELERTERAINDWGLSIVPPPRPSKVKAVDVPKVPTSSPLVSSVSVSDQATASPSPTDKDRERVARTSGTPSPLVPAPLAGWFNESSGGD